MADAIGTNVGSTATSSEVSLPVDGKGWVDLITQYKSTVMSSLMELASQTSLSAPLQAAMDSLDPILNNVMLHVRTNEFAIPATTSTTATSAGTASANPRPGGADTGAPG